MSEALALRDFGLCAAVPRREKRERRGVVEHETAVFRRRCRLLAFSAAELFTTL